MRFGVCLIAFLAVSPSSAEEWPQWRGPRRDGTSHENLGLESWPEDGPAVVWKRDIGQGFSGVSVAAGYLYTQWAEGVDAYVVKLRADDGREVWRTRVGDAFRDFRGSGPRATPTIDGDRLYVLTARGALVALSRAEGELLWSRDLVAEHGGERPIWGFSSSPLVVDDRVVVPGGGEGASLLAFDRGDGRVVWSTGTDPAAYSSPIEVTIDGRRQLVFVTASKVVATSIDGEVLWSHPWTVNNGIAVVTPLFIPPNGIFVSASYDVGSVLLRVGSPEGGLLVEPVWQSKVMKNHFQDSVLFEGHLYGFDNGTLKCVEAATGAERWRHRGQGKGSLILAGEQLIILSEWGRLTLARASPASFEPLAAADVVQSRTWTSPTLADGHLYVRTESSLINLDLRATADLRVAAESPAKPSRAASDRAEQSDLDRLVAGQVEARGGRERWREISSLKMTATVNMNGRMNRCVLWRHLERARLECALADFTKTFVLGREGAWLRNYRRDELSAATGEELIEHRLLVDMFASELDQAMELEVKGEETVETGPSYVLRVTSASGPEEDWYLDRTSLQIVKKVRRIDWPEEGPREVSLYRYDFRSVDGVLFPHLTEVDLGTSTFSMQLLDVELNPEVSDALFSGPAPSGGDSRVDEIERQD